MQKYFQIYRKHLCIKQIHTTFFVTFPEKLTFLVIFPAIDRGDVVQWENNALARRRLGFESLQLHCGIDWRWPQHGLISRSTQVRVLLPLFITMVGYPKGLVLRKCLSPLWDYEMNWLTQLLDRLLCWIPRIQLVSPDESGIRVTLGKRVKSTPPGWYVYWPLIQKIMVITVTPQVVDIRPQSVLTHDGKSLCCGGAIKYRIKDSAAAILKVQDYDKTLQALCLGVISRYFASRDAGDYGDLENCVLKGVKEAARGWGLDILAVYITDIGISRNIRLLMDRSNIEIVRNDETM